MTRRITYTIAGFSIAIMIVIAGFFLLSIDRTAIHIWALSFLILSLLISMASLITLSRRKNEKDAIFYNAGTVAAIGIYQLAVIVSVAFVRAFDGRIGRFVFVEIAILALFAIAVLAINIFARHVHNSNVRTQDRQQSGENNTQKRGGF